MRRILIAVLAVVFLTHSAFPMSLELYQENERKGEPFRTLNTVYLTGVHDGFMASNAALQSIKQPMTYCQPTTVQLHPEQVKDILLKMLGRLHFASEDDVAVILLLGLKDAFPCEAK